MKILNKVRLLHACFLFPITLSAQLSYTVDDMLGRLNTIDWANGDVATTRVNFDNRFAEMTTIASDDELAHIALTENPLMQQHAIAALINRKSPALLSIFTSFTISDKPYTAADGRPTTAAAQFYTAIIKQKENIIRKAYYERTATAAQIAELRILFGAGFDTNWTITETDSLLQAFNAVAFANDRLAPETLNAIFRGNDYQVGDHERVRSYAEQHQTPDILAALATFRNQSDIPLLLQYFDHAMPAIARFPAAAFVPRLQAVLNSQYQNAEFQKAVASYRNADAAKMLTLIINKIISNNASKPDERADRLLQLYNIIESADCKLYDGLLKRLQTL